MMNLHVLFCNPIINCGLFAWFLAQAVKVVLYAFLARKLDLGRFVSSGGMPSSHSALVVACTTAIGRHDRYEYGFRTCVSQQEFNAGAIIFTTSN